MRISVYSGLVELTDHCRHDVRSLQIIVIMRSVKVCGHTADKVIPVLSLEKFAHLKSRNLSDGVRFVGLLKRSCQKRTLGDRLWSHLRIDTGTAQKQQFLHVIIMAAFNHITLNLQILIGKLSRRGIIGIDTADPGRCQHHHIRFLRLKKLPHCLLACKIQLSMGPADNIAVSFLFKISHDRTAHKPSVSCYINFVCFVHALPFPPF